MDKQAIVSLFGRASFDTGSPEVQIAILTAKIEALSKLHFNIHKKDKHSYRGLLNLINKRKRLLSYLKAIHMVRYVQITQRLKLRR
ncbi:30S ribosomal protein S15 [Candidatus Tremblaya phenacola]|uniref:Small ribosomal subunit protein uS15 n=1 Tax=Candidatus Tremblayella phenacoccinincola TaxID=1010676 RepID=A0A2G0V765_9PROT|nr:30S ribosomal protein S15 [Candidatus Tremblaya phenacola]PHN16292.1 30S ribosomal protein S15 [Candidatus Tremblaya phenacola]